MTPGMVGLRPSGYACELCALKKEGIFPGRTSTGNSWTGCLALNGVNSVQAQTLFLEALCNPSRCSSMTCQRVAAVMSLPTSDMRHSGDERTSGFCLVSCKTQLLCTNQYRTCAWGKVTLKAVCAFWRANTILRGTVPSENLLYRKFMGNLMSKSETSKNKRIT